MMAGNAKKSDRQERRSMGLDIGLRRIGVALSDPLGMTAQPLETVQVAASKHLDRIAALCEEHGVDEIVAGIPYEMDGKAGTMVRRVRKILAKVEAATGLEVVEVDERLTTRQAHMALSEAGMDHRARRKVVDQVAAALILQCHLDARGRRP